VFSRPRLKADRLFKSIVQAVPPPDLFDRCLSSGLQDVGGSPDIATTRVLRSANGFATVARARACSRTFLKKLDYFSHGMALNLPIWH
jgi:hypothetical protein